MIGYVVLGTNDLARAASFYDEFLAEMGVTRMMEFGERGYRQAINKRPLSVKADVQNPASIKTYSECLPSARKQPPK